jgi:hypothetical protein
MGASNPCQSSMAPAIFVRRDLELFLATARHHLDMVTPTLGAYFITISRCCTGTEAGLMIDALFWYTGLAAWVLIVFAVISTFVVEAYDRSVMKRAVRQNPR